MSKLLYLIRHGHALHNALFPTLGIQAFRIPEVIDSPLTEIGLSQASELGDSWLEKYRFPRWRCDTYLRRIAQPLQAK